jgi:Zn-dependent metalloprotease
MFKEKMKEYGKIAFNLTLFFVACCILSNNMWAAKKIKFYKADKASFVAQLNQSSGIDGDALSHSNSMDGKAMSRALGLSRHGELEFLREYVDLNGVSHERYVQLFKGIPVWGMQTILSRDSSGVINLHGTMVHDIAKDITSLPPKVSLDPISALQEMQNNHMDRDCGAKWNFSREEYGTYIYIDNKEKAHLVYVVSYLADIEGGGNPSQPVYIIEVKTGKILFSFDKLSGAVGTGPGGNEKSNPAGPYEYGSGGLAGFGVTQSGTTCTMDTADVKTVDLQHGGNLNKTTAYSFTCSRNTHQADVNGAYCVLNDAQYFGQVVVNMYNGWIGVDPLPYQVVLKVHYADTYDNARWMDPASGNNGYVFFGDGARDVKHPWVVLDMTAHEISHGFTYHNSGLIYADQSGGINEAFSDIAGEAVEWYERGWTDYKVGYDLLQAAGDYLRSMSNPTADGSIDHVADYTPGMSVHSSSGIYRKAFYLIASDLNWSPAKAFKVFARANQVYWDPDTTFQQGAQDVLDAAKDLGFDCAVIESAFAQVGITLVCNVPPSPATSPYPSNFATNVSVSQTLYWGAGSGATSHKVYFGTDSTPDSGEYKGTFTSTSYSPGTLAYSTTYYWRIDEVNSAGTTTGSVWRFTTQAAPQMSYVAIADAYVSQTSPNSNYGRSTLLFARSTHSGQGKSVYLKFYVYGATGSVKSAKLRIRTWSYAFLSSRIYHMTSTSWGETSITWNNAPLGFYSQKALGYLSANTWHDIDVTSYVSGNGWYTFGLTGGDYPSQAFWSRETSSKPTLIVEYW